MTTYTATVTATQTSDNDNTATFSISCDNLHTGLIFGHHTENAARRCATRTLARSPQLAVLNPTVTITRH